MARKNTNQKAGRSRTREGGRAATTKAGQVLTRMRRGDSLASASRDIGVDVRTVERLAGSALKKDRSGRYAATNEDRLARDIRIPAPDGLRDVTVRDSKQASLVGEYWNEVHNYLAKGDDSGLARFEGRTVIDANGRRVPLLVDREALDELGNAGVLSFESIYAKGV